MGGFQIAQYLMASWTDENGKQHIGFIDKNDDYMKLRMDDPEYVGNSEKLRLFNFKKNKTEGYERLQAAVNQGLVTFPKSLNIRNEIEFEETDPETGALQIRYEKPALEDIDSLTQISIAKEELASMVKVKKPNGNVVIDQTPQAKAKNIHDDRADCIMLMCDRLMEIRADEALISAQPESDFSKMFTNRGGSERKKEVNPFVDKINPFFTGRGNTFR